MEDKILGFQFEPVSTKPTCPSYNNGSTQDEPQKQPLEVFCKKRCSQKFCRIHRKTPVSESLSCVFQCFPVNFAKFLRTSLLQNTSGRRLLEPETQHNRLSSQEWCNCQNKKISTRLECVCCHEIPEVKAFNLKGKIKTLLEYH